MKPDDLKLLSATVYVVIAVVIFLVAIAFTLKLTITRVSLLEEQVNNWSDDQNPPVVGTSVRASGHPPWLPKLAVTKEQASALAGNAASVTRETIMASGLMAAGFEFTFVTDKKEEGPLCPVCQRWELSKVKDELKGLAVLRTYTHRVPQKHGWYECTKEFSAVSPRDAKNSGEELDRLKAAVRRKV